MMGDTQLTIPTDWLQPNGLSLPADLSKSDWQHIGWAFLYLDTVSQWAIGDCYNTGVERYGPKTVVEFLEDLKKCYPYLHLSSLKLKTIRNYASLCKSFPMHSRNWECLGFWHYYKVAGYEPDERDAHLSHANTMEMTLSQFERYLQEQDKSRKKDEDKEQRTEDLARQNGNLQEHVKALEDTVELFRERVEEVEAQNDYLTLALQDREARLAAARASDEDTSDGNGWQVPETVTCPECGAVIDVLALER